MSAKPRHPKVASKTSTLQNDGTKQEIDRQHALLLGNLDRKQLRGNATMEDHRHLRQATSLTLKEKRGRYHIKTEKNELLNDLHKVRSSYTGHYDDSKTPFENIQQALKTKCQTPPRNSRMPSAPNLYAMRRCRSNDVLRSSTSLGSPIKPPIRPVISIANQSSTSNSKSFRPKTAVPSLTNSKPWKATSAAEKSSKKDKS